MAKLAYPDLAAISIVRKAPKLSVALLAGAGFLFSSLAAEPVHAKNGRGVGIAVGAFGLGVMLNEASRAEDHGGYDDDDDYQERSYRKASKPRPARTPSKSPEVQFSQEMLETQKSLNQAGYNAGTEDGVGGRQTTAAVKAFQRGFGYEETGKLTAAQRKRLYVVAPEMANPTGGGGAQEVPAASDVSPEPTSVEQGSYKPKFGIEAPRNETKTVPGHENMRQTVPETETEGEIEPAVLEVEKALFSLQLIKSVPDGKIDEETVAAIKQYQSHFNQTPTGELDPEQRAKLISMVQVYFSLEKN